MTDLSRFLCLALAGWALVATPLYADDLAEARALYSAGKKPEAIALLQKRLQDHPTDGDARVVLGNFLAWNDRYDEAREVLEASRAAAYRGDVQRALINVELWSSHPERAEKLAAEGLEHEPDAADLRILRARALRNLRRTEDARGEVDRALALAPRDEAALGLRDSLAAELRLWEVDVDANADWFNRTFAPWWEARTTVSRRTGFGPVIFRASHAHRFDSDDNLFELEAYPHLREGTYAFVSVGFSPQALLYPHARVALDLYQSLGEGFEASIGYRGLFFSSTTHIVVGSFGKYFGNWFAFVRGYWVIPSGGSTSGSIHFNLRRYFADGESYLGARYARGQSRDELFTTSEFQFNSADTIALEASLLLPKGFNASARASMTRQGQSGQSDLLDWSLSGGVGYRF